MNRKTPESCRACAQAVELLAPCGTPAALRAALAAGANAVYLGLDKLNMRVGGAHNFTLRSLPEASACCRAAGAKLYLTLNTIVFDGERAELYRMLDAAAPYVDAVIASDWAVFAACQRRGMEAHASTQLSCANADAARFLVSQGIRRVVLARECTLSEVAAIADAIRPLGGEIEIFVHGAQCVAESGRCFLSHFAYGASANRGECQQPCRRPYTIVREENEDSPRPRAEFAVGAHTILSARDLCSLPFLDKIVATGAASLKIEGRARPPEYVTTVVGAYRAALDALAQGTWSNALAAELTERCAEVYHRRFGVGLFHGRPGADQFTDNDENLATRRKRNVGVVEHDYPRAGFVQIRVQDAAFRLGDRLSIQGPSTGEVRFEVTSIRRDEAVLTEAVRGNWVTVPRPAKVRPNDRVYLLEPAT